MIPSEVKEESMKDSNKRKLKVYKLYSYMNHAVPQIRFQGKWLRSFGFDIGDEIDIICENEKLVIYRRAK